MGNFEERFLSDKIFIRQAFYQTRFLSDKIPIREDGCLSDFSFLMLLTWTAQQSICQPHHGEPHKETTTPVPESLFHSHPTSIPPEFPPWNPCCWGEWGCCWGDLVN